MELQQRDRLQVYDLNIKHNLETVKTLRCLWCNFVTVGVIFLKDPEFLKSRDRMAGQLEPMSEFEKNPVRSQNLKVEENLRKGYSETTYVLNVRNRAGLDDEV